jgi:hypothetical protein
MNINDTVFLIQPASFHKYLLPNSVQIVPVKVDSIRDSSIVVLISIDDAKLLLEVEAKNLFPHLSKALEQVQKILTADNLSQVNEIIASNLNSQQDED